jgi:lipopolysaccharide biosynthesis regulator YciM
MSEDIEEVKDSLEVKEQKETTFDKATESDINNSNMRISIKTAKILTFTNPYVKAVKELKIQQQNNSQTPLIISFHLNKTQMPLIISFHLNKTMS